MRYSACVLQLWSVVLSESTLKSELAICPYGDTFCPAVRTVATGVIRTPDVMFIQTSHVVRFGRRPYGRRLKCPYGQLRQCIESRSVILVFKGEDAPWE